MATSSALALKLSTYTEIHPVQHDEIVVFFERFLWRKNARIISPYGPRQDLEICQECGLI